MPRVGPDGQQAYLPHEAYDAIGRHHFKDTWTAVFTPGEALPHPLTAKRTLDRTESDSNLHQIAGDPTTAEYEFRQQRAFRTSKTLSTLLEALAWGKTEAWCKKENDWSSVNYDQWHEGSEHRDLLLEELRSFFIDNNHSSENLLINKELLDQYLGDISNSTSKIDPDGRESNVTAVQHKQHGPQIFASSDDLIADTKVAELLSMSKSWVRKQRFDRRHGNPHVFDIDPILIGKSPRYRLSDVKEWLNRQVD